MTVAATATAGPGSSTGTALAAFAASARMQFIETRTSVIVLTTATLFPVMLLLVTLLPAADRSAAAGTRAAFATGLSAAWSATAWGAASVLRRERATGTLARALMGIPDPRVVALGKGLGASTLSAGLIVVTVAATLAVLRQPVEPADPAAVVVGLAVLVASGAAVGLLVGTVFVVTRYGAQVSAALTTPVLVFGGMLVPPSQLAPALRWIPSLVSLRWLNEFLISSATGAPNLVALAMATALTVAYGAAGAWLFARVADRARTDGSIDLY